MENFTFNSPYGYILYIGSKCKCKVNVSLTVRKTVENSFKKIHSYLCIKKNTKTPKKRNLL
ncbi:MAG: hypothetical protein ACFFAN_20720 [Promethearchaeota archaeon]